MTAGLYLHIPFCKSRCSYCDFATDVFRSDAAVDRYVNALTAELGNFNSQISDLKSRIDSVYFGGGTPSLLSPAQLESIMSAVHEKFDVADDTEITLEMNPATVTPEKLRDFRSLGVNRASFGVQTFNDEALKLLARGHDANDARRTFDMLRAAGFDNISFDLIAGLPGQDLADWTRNLDEALAMSPEHLSLYLLEIHEGTPLAQQLKSGRRPLPDEDVAAEMYELLVDRTAAAGLAQYEISNFARVGRESRHNSKYWLCETVYACGVSAHSFDGRVRRANERDTNRYVELIESGASPVVEEDRPDAKQLAGEFAFLRLRLTKGIDLNEYETRFGIDIESDYADDIARLRELELIDLTGKTLRLTRRGMVFSNEVFSIFT